MWTAQKGNGLQAAAVTDSSQGGRTDSTFLRVTLWLLSTYSGNNLAAPIKDKQWILLGGGE